MSDESTYQRLYLGTTAPIARRAWREGLSAAALDPEDRTKLVCLTDSYAVAFAKRAASAKAERWAIIEIDVSRINTRRLRPHEQFCLIDEDARRDSQARGGKPDPAWFRQHLTHYSSLWPSSLDDLGLCYFAGDIPVTALSRVAVFDPDRHPAIADLATAKVPTKMQHHLIVKWEHQCLMRWMLGESVRPAHLLTLGDISPIFEPWSSDIADRIEGRLREEQPEAYASILATLADRSGLKVIQRAALPT